MGRCPEIADQLYGAWSFRRSGSAISDSPRIPPQRQRTRIRR